MSYTDRPRHLRGHARLRHLRQRAAAVRALFQLELERPLPAPLTQQDLKGYLQFDMADKGDMFNGLEPGRRNTGLPRILQPSYIAA